MKKNNIFFTLIFLVFASNLMAREIKYKLRRFDSSDFYDNNCTGSNFKYYKKLNDEDDDSSFHSVNKLPVKDDGQYQGYYKVGNPYTVFGQTYYPEENQKYKEVGMASWYGSDFHNKKTSNGEIYDMHDYTAAHRTLPMPCIVRVTNLENGKSMKVRVNDRGPFVKDRIIDVSKNVAKKLDFHQQGTTKVRVEYLKKDSENLLDDYDLNK